MPFGEFTIDDIVPYLNQELPGFEPTLIREPEVGGRSQVMIRVKTNVPFAGYATLDTQMFLPVNSYSLRSNVEQWIEKTRYDVIQKLGLQKQIDKEVERKLNSERQRIRQEEFEKAYSKAMSEVSAAAAPNIEAIRFFLNGGQG